MRTSDRESAGSAIDSFKSGYAFFSSKSFPWADKSNGFLIECRSELVLISGVKEKRRIN